MKDQLIEQVSDQEERDKLNPVPSQSLYESDPFLSNGLVVYRLKDSLLKHGNLIVAFDFDDTVYDFHQRGSEYPKLINLIRKCHQLGWPLVMYTSRSGDRLKPAVEYCEQNDIPFDYVNDHVPGVPYTGGKVHYNILLDDKAGLASAYDALSEVVHWAENRIKQQQD